MVFAKIQVWKSRYLTSWACWVCSSGGALQRSKGSYTDMRCRSDRSYEKLHFETSVMRVDLAEKIRKINSTVLF